MSESLPELCSQFRLQDDGRIAVVNSRDVAEKFGKQHHHVMRDIQNLLDANPDLVRRNWFRSNSYIDEQGKPRPSFDLTRDGFALLVQGWTGAKALEFKIRYIDAFNAMEALLQSRDSGGITHTQFMEAIREIVRPLAIRFSDQEVAINRIEDNVDHLRGEVAGLGAKVEGIDRHIRNRIRTKTKKHERLLAYVIARFYGGRCPVTGEQILDQDGSRIRGRSEIDHFYTVNSAEAANLWLISKKAHDDLTYERVPRQEWEPHFKGFQHKLKTLHPKIIEFPKRPNPSLF